MLVVGPKISSMEQSQPIENMNTRDRQISLHADVFMGFGFLKRGG